MRKVLGILVLLLVFLPVFASAATINAASCSQADVQAAVGLASNGSGSVIVQLPMCNEIWAIPLNINMLSGFTDVTSLTIQGAGAAPAKGSANQTVIDSAGFSITTKTNKKIRISNMKFTGAGTAKDSNFFVIMGNTRPSLGGGFRIDHISFNGGHAIQGYAGDCYGVIDHNTGGTKGQFAGWIWGTDHYLGGGNIAWSSPSTVGEADNVFFEDNEFIQTDSIKKWMICDGTNGARIVARYNVLTDYYIGGHDASSVDRSLFSYEAYGNIFYASWNYMAGPFGMRGGSGHFFNNQIIAASDYPFYETEISGIGLYNYRSYHPSLGSVPPWGTTCDNTPEKGCVNGNVFLSKTCNTDADCEGVVGSCAQLDGNMDGTGYPCRDQWGRSTNQTLAPTLFWNNTLSKNGGSAKQTYPTIPTDMANYIREGRDYCAHTTCTGTSCNYNCGLVSVSYNAYIYPHPLAVAPFGTAICGEGAIASSCWCQGMKSTGYCCHGYYQADGCDSGSVTPPPPPPSTVAGDLNSDGRVDISDLVIVATNFGKSSGFDSRANVVSSSPEIIDIADLSFVARRFTG